MPPRSTIEQLPEDVRSELDARLVRGGFADYRGLADWLTSIGFEIKKSAVHAYGQRFEDRCSALKLATQQARAIVAESPDDEGAMSEALMRLVQEKLFSVLLEIEVDPKKINLGGLAKSIAELGRATVTQKKWAAEAREKIKEKLDAMEADGAAGKRTIDPATLKTIREEVYGLL